MWSFKVGRLSGLAAPGDGRTPVAGFFCLVTAPGLRQAAVVNTASQNLAHHLEVLGQKLQHPTAYELALSYFLEEFAGDAKFVHESEADEALHLKAVLTQAAAQALELPDVEIKQFKAFRVLAHGFNHGNGAVAGRVLLFFYFEKLDTGLMALFPGVRGEAEVARFRVPGGLTDPRKN